MPYTTTAEQFLDEQLPAALVDGSPLREQPYLVKFVIEGVGTWFADFATGTVAREGGLVDVIVRARPRDFMAVIEGRMSPQDGLLTGRLHLAGAVSKITALMKVLRHA